ncbi:MAG: hypothetical protein ABEJ83_03110 [Candidatus Nanohaloarchaea archaeon]
MKRLLQKLEKQYGIDRKELGKTLLVASAAILAVTVPTVLELQSAAKELDAANTELNKASTIIQGQDFQESLEALESVEGTNLAPRYLTAAEAFRTAQNATENLEEVEEGLRSGSKIYQWITLLSILGIVAGATILHDPEILK